MAVQRSRRNAAVETQSIHGIPSRASCNRLPAPPTTSLRSLREEGRRTLEAAMTDAAHV